MKHLVFLTGALLVTGAADSGELPAGEARNPAPFTSKSVESGRQVFLENCAACHGTDGKAKANAMATARDLTAPKFFVRGSSDAAMFATIEAGLNNGMPPFKDVLGESDRWDVVNFIKSLWADSPKPK